MANKDIKKIDRFFRIYSLKEKVALNVLGIAYKKNQKAIKRHDDILIYQKEYQVSVMERAKKNISISLYQSNISFLNQLDNLLIQQKEICKKNEVEISFVRKKWLDAHNKTGVIKKLLKDKINTNNRLLDKSEEKSLEDFMSSRKK